MHPIIIDCSGITSTPHTDGVLSNGVERLHDQLIEHLGKLTNQQILSPSKFILSNSVMFEGLNSKSSYEELVDIEVKHIAKQLHATKYDKVKVNTNSWTFIRDLAKISGYGKVYVVKPLLADVVADELWVMVNTNDKNGNVGTTPADYIDFLYLIYSRGLYFTRLHSNTQILKSDMFTSLIRSYYEYLISLLPLSDADAEQGEEQGNNE